MAWHVFFIAETPLIFWSSGIYFPPNPPIPLPESIFIYQDQNSRIKVNGLSLLGHVTLRIPIFRFQRNPHSENRTWTNDVKLPPIYHLTIAKPTLKLKDVGVEFDPLIFAWVMRSFNRIYLGVATHSTITSKWRHGFRLGPHEKPCPLVKKPSLFTNGSSPFGTGLLDMFLSTCDSHVNFWSTTSTRLSWVSCFTTCRSIGT